MDKALFFCWECAAAYGQWEIMTSDTANGIEIMEYAAVNYVLQIWYVEVLVVCPEYKYHDFTLEMGLIYFCLELYLSKYIECIFFRNICQVLHLDEVKLKYSFILVLHIVFHVSHILIKLLQPLL